MKLSKISQTIPASPIRKLVKYADEAKKKGVHIYHLNIGNPDIKTPQVMIDVLKNWSMNPIGYSDSHGDSKMLESMLSYYHKLGFTDLTTSNIQITLGGSEGLLWSFLSVANPGEEIITFEPLYANYVSYAQMVGVNLVPILTTIDTGFHLPDSKKIEEKITAKTRAILLGNPGNPTGVVYTQKELDMIVAIAKKHDLYVLSDEVYREFVYDGKKSISILSYKNEIKDQIIVIDSLSKRYSLCGARMGALVSYNKDLMESFLRYGQARLSAGIVDEHIAAKLVDVPKKYFSEVVSEYEGRRNLLVEGLRQIPGVVCPKPEGAFYIIVGLPVADAENFATWLLTHFRDNNETVMIAPAAGFYSTLGLGKNEVRIAYVLNKQSLARSIGILEKALKIYNKSAGVEPGGRPKRRGNSES